MVHYVDVTVESNESNKDIRVLKQRGKGTDDAKNKPECNIYQASTL